MLIRSLKTRVARDGLRRVLGDAGYALRPADLGIWKVSAASAGFLDPGGLAGQIRLLSGPLASNGLKELRARYPGLPAEFYRDEFEPSGNCVVACIDRRPAAVAWTYDHRVTGHILRMHPGDAEIRSVYSLTQLRGRGLGRAVIAAACDFLFSHGSQNVYAVIHSRNLASQKAFASVGFTKIARLTRRALFGPRFDTRSGRTQNRL